MTKKHEWKSVSFIRHSCSLHYGRFMLSSLKEGQANITIGGVTASFGMLGDIIIGEPDATIAFAGKRVIEEVMKIEVPEGVQEAEYLGSLDSNCTA
jgi:acetyl-CoA carboxylase beta subunit